ncbi:hypothetical protein CVU83_01560 [Candidatus Falkowbacteria bacterium HGW-Falkowbacteria-2]|uniref:Uncharacterized protein n=1 Tax=Candidatus Falkowbacteria bacterium HGW-Falkowbacteria-2 TaxID=2013769 RepID=A0A2N2E1I2_9BACT|nr:MAG: hypothetical protein CVU83_01560 [Candidatus Falkowbacteria bacterium HGW-Falkowbacteria-2]
MEAAISSIVIGFVILTIVYVEMFLHRKPLTEKEISDYQVTLDKMSIKAKVDYNLDYNFDSKTQLLESRRQTKAMYLILAGLLIVFSFLGLLLTDVLSLVNIGIMCTSALLLICYGIIKIAESKKLAVGMLLFVLVAGSLAKFVFDSMMMSGNVYFYLCGAIVLISILSLTPRFRKA